MNTSSRSTPANIIVISQFMVVSGYRSFLEHLAEMNPQARLSLVVPARFRELGHQLVQCEPLSEKLSTLIRMSVLKAFAPHVQIMILWGLTSVFRSQKARSQNAKTLLIAMVEPYSVSFLWIWFCLKFSGLNADLWALTFQNIYKKLPWPLQWIQQLCFRSVSCILAGGQEHQAVLRKQGYHGPVVLFPLWYDERRFFLKERTHLHSDRIRVGICGKIAFEKGVFDFLDAIRILDADGKERIQVCIAGGGPDRLKMEEELGKLEQEGWLIDDQGALPFDQIPQFFSSLDVLVVPSRTMHNWKEQFGRVIVEAMACGVTVIGSDSGEIPHVIGRSDRIFREAEARSLAECLKNHLRSQDFLRAENHRYARDNYSSMARAEHFTQVLAGCD